MSLPVFNVIQESRKEEKYSGKRGEGQNKFCPVRMILKSQLPGVQHFILLFWRIYKK
jgi:hypothetical protein